MKGQITSEFLMYLVFYIFFISSLVVAITNYSNEVNETKSFLEDSYIQEENARILDTKSFSDSHYLNMTKIIFENGIIISNSSARTLNLGVDFYYESN